jgi:ATP-binding cassette subfamily B multidrug efflux pump
MKVFIDLMWYFKQEKRAYGSGVILLLAVAMLQLIPPKVVGFIVDSIKGHDLTKKSLLIWVGTLLIVGIAMYILRYYWRIMIFGSSMKLARILRNRLYYHFSQMSSSFFQKRRIGDLMAHATNDVQAVQQTAGVGVLTFVDSLATGGSVILAMAITISWKLTLICLIPMPVMVILTSYYGKLLHQRFHRAQESFSSLNDKTQESISGIKVIKTFGQEQEDIEDFRLLSEEVVEKNMTVAKVDSLFDPTISLVVGISFFLSIVFGSRLVINNELSIGQLVSFTTYLGLLIWPMLAFGMLFNIMERGRASYDRIQLLLAEPIEIQDQLGVLNTVPSGDIKFAIDTFRYPNEKEKVLNNIFFEIGHGKTLGIVGKTGSGKTTLLKLLIREFQGYEGEIEFGDHSIDKFTLDSLRSSIGYVPQDHFLFSSSIAKNIAFTNPTIQLEEIKKAARTAFIHSDIESFSEGYNTMVGERGVSLSGGQKQRISIARAIVVNPEVLILDDSLSAVDAKTEESILSSLKKDREGKTTIITAHRLSAIQHADLIIVLDNGTISEKGTHEELMEQRGWYKKMYEQQKLEDLVEQGG